jgi:large subunit ribosomal protein L6
MSRIGKLPIALPKGVDYTVDSNNLVTVKGAKGTLTVQLNPEIQLEKVENEIVLKRPDDSKKFKALHGLYRALLQNAVIGVNQGYTKTLEIIGVGFRASMNGSILELALGYSHPFYFIAPSDVTVEVDVKSAKTQRIIISGIDKEIVGQVAAKIRSLRPPEPYKGKGVRYLNEVVRKKAGKSAGK